LAAARSASAFLNCASRVARSGFAFSSDRIAEGIAELASTSATKMNRGKVILLSGDRFRPSSSAERGQVHGIVLPLLRSAYLLFHREGPQTFVRPRGSRLVRNRQRQRYIVPAYHQNAPGYEHALFQAIPMESISLSRPPCRLNEPWVARTASHKLPGLSGRERRNIWLKIRRGPRRLSDLPRVHSPGAGRNLCCQSGQCRYAELLRNQTAFSD